MAGQQNSTASLPLGQRRGGCVTLHRDSCGRRPVMKFRLVDDVPCVNGTVDREDTVEVVNLVLQQFGESSLRLQQMSFPFSVLIPDFHREISPDFDGDVRETKAVIPERNPFPASAHNDRIHQGERRTHVDEEDPFAHADLWRRYSSPEAVPLTDRGDRRSANAAHQCPRF